MAFQILEPEIKSVPMAVWDYIKFRWQFWSILMIVSVLLIILTFRILNGKWSNYGFEGFFFPLFIFVVIMNVVLIEERIMASFWKQLADINGWQYKRYDNPNHQESGVMFRKGDKRYISNIIEGSINNRHFRIFSYGFTVGSGKNKRGHDYTVFAFKFNGSFPHIYLNNRHDRYSISAGEEIPLPEEFEKNFSLSAPKEYEIEALEIFTPDVLTSFLNGGFTYDIEFVNQEMLIFTKGRINNFEKLEKEFKRALELEDLLDEKLDKFKFQPIGDRPHSL